MKKIDNLIETLTICHYEQPEIDLAVTRMKRFLEQEKKISGKVLLERARRIRPVIHLDNDGKPLNSPLEDCFYRGKPFKWLKSTANLKTSSYIWDIKPEDTKLDACGLQEEVRYKCYHTTGCLFKPSIAECLQQIPDVVNLDSIVAFELRIPDNVHLMYEDALSMHISTVILYSGAMPAEVLNYPIGAAQ